MQAGGALRFGPCPPLAESRHCASGRASEWDRMATRRCLPIRFDPDPGDEFGHATIFGTQDVRSCPGEFTLEFVGHHEAAVLFALEVEGVAELQRVEAWRHVDAFALQRPHALAIHTVQANASGKVLHQRGAWGFTALAVKAVRQPRTTQAS